MTRPTRAMVLQDTVPGDAGSLTDPGVSGLQVDADRPRTAQELAYDTLRRGILSGDLPPGTKLNQSAVAKRLRVSTTPVREALGRLAGDGLVRIDAHRGALVRGVNDEELEEIYELRQILEPLAARKAAAHITEAQLAEAEQLWQRMQDHSDAARWAENNRHFHAVIVAASRSPNLTAILKSLQASSARYVQWSLTVTPERFVTANHDHRQLLDALLSRDGDRAAAIEGQHLDATVAVLRARHTQSVPTDPS